LDPLIERLFKTFLKAKRGPGFFPPQKGLSRHQTVILVHAQKPVSVSALRLELHLSAATLSQELAVMEQKELLRRDISPDDRRVVTVQLTEKGAALCRQHRKELDRIFSAVKEKLGTEKISAFIDTLDQILDIINKENDPDA